MDKALHTVGALLLHLIRHVSVDVQRERCRGVAEIALYGFDIVSGLQCCYSVGVPHVMETNVRCANLGDNLLEMVVDRIGVQVAAKLIGKDQVHRILEAFAMFKLPGHLLLLGAVQDIHDLPGGLQLSGLPVLGRDENTLSISQSQFRVRCNSRVLPEYLVYYFHTRIGHHKLLSNASQVGVPALARASTTFQTIKIDVPSIDNQRSIVNLLEAIRYKTENNSKINDNLAA